MNSRTSGHNLVIHEFAHQLDFLDGYTDGAPALSSRDQTQRWQRLMQSPKASIACGRVPLMKSCSTRLTGMDIFLRWGEAMGLSVSRQRR